MPVNDSDARAEAAAKFWKDVHYDLKNDAEVQGNVDSIISRYRDKLKEQNVDDDLIYHRGVEVAVRAIRNQLNESDD